jgi:2-keto-4-pentenoate hydratase
MSTSINQNEMAEALWSAAHNHQQISPLSSSYGLTNITDAYQIQEINNHKRIANGEIVVGKKIGLTSFAVQKQLGVDQPDYGLIFQTNQVKNGGTTNIKNYLQPKVEAEIALVLGSDLSGDITIENLIRATDYAIASIEIVDSRIQDWKITITDTIADNASASHFVLGEKKEKLENLDLVNGKMELFKNGILVSEGKGEACMGNPLNAALWLAKTMISLGVPLKKGEILLTGALGPMIAVEAGDEIAATIAGLGEVSVIFAE